VAPILNPAATAQVHHHNYNNTSNSLDQYANHYQFASINQSLLIRNLNYSILQGELEHEAALEDMHMFFVAFNKRQKRIVECLEKKIPSSPVKIINIDENGSLQKSPIAIGSQPNDRVINVVHEFEEVDLE
jgi:hypothetical protein